MNHTAIVMLRLRNGSLKPVRKAIRTVSFAFPVEDACMMIAIAKHYQVSNSAFGIELFSPMIKALVKDMDASLQQKLARDADAESVAYLKKGGSVQEVPNTPPVNLTYWQDAFPAIAGEEE